MVPVRAAGGNRGPGAADRGEPGTVDGGPGEPGTGWRDETGVGKDRADRNRMTALFGPFVQFVQLGWCQTRETS
jgi:hypothetical protein